MLRHERGSGYERQSLGKPPPLQDQTTTGKYRLLTERNVLNRSVLALKFAAFTHTLSTTVLNPNYPFMVIPDNHPDSFPNTDPFGFIGATYFLPLSGLLAVSLVSAFAGSLSDKYGRRPVLLISIAGSCIFTIAKYFARHTFWGFCTVSFVNGLFGGVLPVAMAYVSDVHPSRKEKSKAIGQLIGQNMIAITGGGIAAILMKGTGLFTPLLLAAGLNGAAFLFLYAFLVEPHQDGNQLQYTEDVDTDEVKRPETIDKKLLWNVVFGALCDNVGSAGLVPLALSPLSFETFYLDFVDAGEEPIMAESAYGWIFMLLALMVVPGAMMSSPIFQKIGAAGGCVFGNIITAIGIASCILIATIPEPQTASYAGYIVFLYLIMPFTVVSQLSTGPMLDMLAPINRKGFVQGLNATTMNLSRAVTPFLLGTLADRVGTEECMWTCVGISLLAALVNTPLLFTPLFKPKPTKNFLTKHARKDFEDEEVIGKILDGDWVPAKVLMEINAERYEKGIPFLVPRVRSYKDDKSSMKMLKENAHDDFEYHKQVQLYHLSLQSESAEARKDIISHLNKSRPTQKVQDENAKAMGQWFADYMQDSGFFLDGGKSHLIKQMIMEAFPPINSDGEVTEKNIESMTLRRAKLFNDYFMREESSNATRAFSNSVGTSFI